ncbi:hypothetical protein TIFTF001_006513 [Ficus carica]|uniref:Uncharacterized protein n=1 Tax=Ficus carica TaxID=3494 RepID=A0AA88D0V3_FICCA|nr:hypothetical protein TIFTF001_006513 [Ficus carica]
MLSEGWVRAVSEPSVESWSPFVVLKSGRVRREGSWIPQELGCKALVRGLGWCMGLRYPLWVACVPHVQLVFPPCCEPSFRDVLITLMVTPALMDVTLQEVAVVPLFSFVCFLCLFVIKAEVSPLVPRVGFCVNLGFVDPVLVVVWWVDLAFASPVVGVFLRVWNRGLVRIFPSGLITCMLSHWFMDFRSIWWFSRSVAGQLAYSEFCSVALSLCWCLSLAL